MKIAHGIAKNGKNGYLCFGKFLLNEIIHFQDENVSLGSNFHGYVGSNL